MNEGINSRHKAVVRDDSLFNSSSVTREVRQMYTSGTECPQVKQNLPDQSMFKLKLFKKNVFKKKRKVSEIVEMSVNF